MSTNLTRRRFLETLAAVGGVAALPAWSGGQPRPRATVRTVAGTGTAGYEPEGAAGLIATRTPVDNPYGIVPGPDGALYFCEVDTGRTRRLDVDSGTLTTIAGTGRPGYTGDGGPADRAHLRQPHSIAFNAGGNLLICDIGNQRIREVDMQTRTILSIAGTGERAPTPDTAPLEGTPLMGPRSLDTDARGNAYLVLREGNAVFRLNQSAGRLERIAGTGERGYTGDGGPALSATFDGPKGIAYSAADESLYIIDTENHVVRRLDLQTNMIETVLGTGNAADGPDGDPLRCSLARPHGVCMHRGVLYVTDSENHRVRAMA